ncbi:MAG: 4'-phosphopantetheinyl transferase family protein [Alphaproteobacteria bacterium]
MMSSTSAIPKETPFRDEYGWEKPPVTFNLDADTLHIWKVNLNALGACGRFHNVVSASERNQGARIIDPVKRKRYLSAHTVLRKILSFYLRRPADAIRFSVEADGKPFVEGASHLNPIAFNISHSGTCMLAAVSKCGAVGIDLEKKHSVDAKGWIVEHYFSKNDCSFFNDIPCEKRQNAFLAAWTLKEAYGKALGTGLSAVHHIDFFKRILRGGPKTGRLQIFSEGPAWFLHFRPCENYIASAVSLSCSRPKPRFFKYTEII